MKHNRLLWFLCLLICMSLSCNLPGHDALSKPGDVEEVTSVSVTPHSGSGSFSATVEGTSFQGMSARLECYISADKNVTEYGPKVVSQNGSNSFEVSFIFIYNVPGTHSLVCLINDDSGSTWSEDFVVVPPATLTITASSATMTFGGTVPTIPPAYSGFVAGDTESSLSIHPVCSTTATSKSPVGKYPTSCSGAIDSDYTISYTDGSVSVTQALLTIGASYVTMTQGGAVPTIAPSYYGFVAGDTESSLTSVPICSTTATSTSPVGKYPTSCSGAVDGNYIISYWDGWVEVTPANPTTLVLNGKFKLPEVGGTCNDGMQYSDPSTAVSGSLVLTVDYTSGQANATLQGAGQATISFCNLPTETITRTIPAGATLHGTLDPGTNILSITGDVAYNYQSTCWIHDISSGTCTPGGQTQTFNLTLSGSIDPAHSSGAGQIQWTGNKDWGNWQVP